MQTLEAIKTKLVQGKGVGLEEFVYWQWARAALPMPSR
jgi:hypothetical protein